MLPRERELLVLLDALFTKKEGGQCGERVTKAC